MRSNEDEECGGISAWGWLSKYRFPNYKEEINV
jgi:hypothetical protein